MGIECRFAPPPTAAPDSQRSRIRATPRKKIIQVRSAPDLQLFSTPSPTTTHLTLYISLPQTTPTARMHFSPLPLLSLATLAASHGLITSPLGTRTPSDATAAVCGKTLVSFYKADNTSYPEALLRANPSGLKDGYNPAKCNLWLCKGFQFADNVANVKAYKPGDVVDIEVRIRIAHRGYANVSVVDTGSNTVIGEPLRVWGDGYAASTSPPQDQVKFSVKVPELGGKCTTAGSCVSIFPVWEERGMGDVG